MSESTSQAADANAPKAPKDKNCPYCGQAFTSSSLGRHLDLYIKEKNPKPPDGIHDVEAIRKLRGGITRRQPRGSTGGRRETSNSSGTPRPPVKNDTPTQDSDGYRSPAIPKDGQYVVDASLKQYAFPPRWEATGVINDIPGKTGMEVDVTQEQNKRPGMQRTVSKQMVQKAQFDVKQKLSDAMDTARAAELALRELLSSWRAAKQQIDNNSMPFDFDPLSLDFPALTLQCLQPPPTLFSSTQHPTSTSWSVQCPGHREFEALRAYFKEEFRSWKVACAVATTSTVEELTYPPSSAPVRDAREAVRKAEKSAENLEQQINEHLDSAYAVWQTLAPQRQQELWVLELARSVGRKHKDMDKMKQEQYRLQQELTNLKTQIDQLNRLQQPREYKIVPPCTIPVDRDIMTALFEMGVSGKTAIGFSLEDRHVDLSTVVSRSIERWKTVIASTRVNAVGMSAQRPLDQPGPPSGGSNSNGPSPQSQSQTQAPQQSMQAQQQMQQQTAPQQQAQSQNQAQALKRLSTASTNGMGSEQTTTSASTTAPPSIEETSDQDADAEMEDDDSFAIMNASPVKPPAPMQQQATLEVPRTRGPTLQQQQQQQQQRGTPDPRFMMPNGTPSPASRAAMNMTRSMPNMSMAMQTTAMHAADMGMAMQGVRGDAMYME